MQRCYMVLVSNSWGCWGSFEYAKLSEGEIVQEQGWLQCWSSSQWRTLKQAGVHMCSHTNNAVGDQGNSIIWNKWYGWCIKILLTREVESSKNKCCLVKDVREQDSKFEDYSSSAGEGPGPQAKSCLLWRSIAEHLADLLSITSGSCLSSSWCFGNPIWSQQMQQEGLSYSVSFRVQ